jgi:hypothetical protein
MSKPWEQNVREYCEFYNIPLEYLVDTLDEPKVVPMIRGKAFEFSAMLKLRRVLPQRIWAVDKTQMNAQTGLHDLDVEVVHKKTNEIVRVECKLADKGSFRANSGGTGQARVKCMRSRTLGDVMVKRIARSQGLKLKGLRAHRDNYVPGNFDIVLTSLGNAFYQTDKSGKFQWQPDTLSQDFLKKMAGGSGENLKDFAFNQMFAAKSSDLAITKGNGVRCSRGTCPEPDNCGFIPNYPIIKFDKSQKALGPWVLVDSSGSMFDSFVGKSVPGK